MPSARPPAHLPTCVLARSLAHALFTGALHSTAPRCTTYLLPFTNPTYPSLFLSLLPPSSPRHHSSTPIEFVLPVCLRQLFPVDISVLRVLSYRRCFRICCFPLGILVFQQVKRKSKISRLTGRPTARDGGSIPTQPLISYACLCLCHSSACSCWMP